MGTSARNICTIATIPKECRERFHALSPYLKERGIVLSGTSTLVQGYEMGRAPSTINLLLYTRNGKGRLFLPDGTSRTLAAGEVFIAPAGTTYTYETERTHWEILWFRFAPDATIFSSYKNAEPFVRTNGETADLFAAMDGYLRESLAQKPLAARLTHLHAQTLAALAERTLAAENLTNVPNDIAHRFNLLWDEVNAHLNRNWTLTEIADAVGLSPTHATRICKALYTTTPMKMVTALRMQRAEEMIVNTPYPLRAIAEAIGYEDEFACSVAVKRFFGKSVRDLRNERRTR